MAAARTFRIACPSCGGTLPLPLGRTIVACPYCGQRGKVRVPGHVPRYAARAAVDRQRVRDILATFFVDPDTPPDMNRRATLRTQELFFVPFYDLHGTRGLVRRTRREARWTETDVTGAGIEESVVNLSEFAFATRATRLPGWGLEHLDVARLQAADSPAEFEPFDGERLAAQGVVLDADRSRDEALAELQPAVGADADRVEDEVVEQRLTLLYIPVWRVTFVYRGRLYVATVEAVTGTVLRARFPENDRFRVPYFLLSAGLVAWIAGVLTRGGLLLSAGRNAGWGPALVNPMTVLLLALFGVFVPVLLTAVLGVSWKVLRYPAEVTVTAGRRFREWVGRPQQTFFDRLLERQLAGIESLFDQVIRGRERE